MSKLGSYKSYCVIDEKYNIPLSYPLQSIPFPVKYLDFNDFLLLLGSRGNVSAPGINAFLYKVYKNVLS